ncbi:MAG: Crp/Fnr family transcriptional regulator [Pseudomonadota bacterium]
MNLNEFIAANGKPLSTEADEHLFRQGDLSHSLYIVKSGLLKAYYLSADGKENIKSFILPGDNIGSLTALYSGQECTFSLVCLKACELIVLRFSDLYEASREDAEISAAIIEFLLKFGMKKEMREYELLCLSAEDRYRRLMKSTPDIFNLVTQNEIARYLGITPVALSRIKKRVSV